MYSIITQHNELNFPYTSINYNNNNLGVCFLVLSLIKCLLQRILYYYKMTKRHKPYPCVVCLALQLTYDVIKKMPNSNAADVQSVLQLSSVLNVATLIPEHLSFDSMVNHIYTFTVSVFDYYMNKFN